MKGIIKFLTNKYTQLQLLSNTFSRKDIRAKILREHFVFKLVPMINVDGVYDGHYRMDIFNQNLNRFYKAPLKETTPAPYAIKELL